MYFLDLGVEGLGWIRTKKAENPHSACRGTSLDQLG